MKTKILIPAFVFMTMFVLAFASATSVTTSLFYDDTVLDSITINDWENTGVIVSADSIFESSMTVRVDLLDSSGNVVAQLLDAYTTSDSYSNHLLVGKEAYSNPGDYIIRSTVTAISGQTDTDILYLEVIPITPGNSAPVITSSPLVEVDESQQYSYQVIATDADGDVLTYSLTQSPAWLSMSNSGFVTGVAPSVSSDYVYALTIRVSDGIDFRTQSFALTVRDTNQQGDTTAPFITIEAPSNGATYSTGSLTFRVRVNEEVIRTWFTVSGSQDVTDMNPAGSNSFEGDVSLSDGNYNVIFYSRDLAGNTGTTSVSFSVNTTVLDTTAPVLTVLSPEQGSAYRSSLIPFEVGANENINAAWYSLDGGANVSMDLETATRFSRIVSLADGNHNVVFYARDLAGNLGASGTISFSVDTVPDTTDPIISVISPVNNQVYGSTNIFLNINSNEALNAAWYSLDGGANVSMNGTGTSWQRTITTTQGSHSIVFYGRDLAGNVGSSSTIRFSVDTSAPDTIPPFITVLSPSNGATYSTGSLDLSVSVSEPVMRAWYVISGNASETDMTRTGASSFGRAVTLNEGSYTITFYATDLAGNTGTTSVSFTISIPSDDGNGKDKSKTIFISNSDDDKAYLEQFAAKATGDEVIDISPVKKLSFWERLWNLIVSFIRWVFG